MTMTMTAPTQVTQIDFGTRVAKFVALRDKIKELNDAHKAKMKPYVDMLDTLNGVLLNHLNSVNTDSVRTEGGTAYRTLKKSATIADKSAFWAWVVTQAQWDLIDYKANAVAVEDHIATMTKAYEEDKANNPAPCPPPGINYTTHWEVGVRRPTGGAK